MKKIIHMLLAALLCALYVVPAQAGGTSETGSEKQASSPAKKKLRLLLDWTPNTNHIGAYVALKRGFFAKYNLDVEIIPFADSSVELLVGNRQAEFGYSYQDSFTFARAAESPVPIVAVAAVIQHNTSGFASLPQKKIRSPEDFAGKTYGAFGSPIEEAIITTLISPYGLERDSVTFIQAGTMDFFTALDREIYDFAWVFKGWTGIESEIREIPLQFIMLSDLAPIFDYYTPLIISSEDFLSSEAAVAGNFMQALQEGYDWAIEHAQEAAAILYESEPALDPVLVRESLIYLGTQFRGEAEFWGKMESEVWERFTVWLQENNFIPAEFNIHSSYTNEFLQHKNK